MTQLDPVTRKLSLFPLTPIVLSQLIQLYKMDIYIYIYIYTILQELWMICGKDETKRVGQFHYIKFQPNWKQTLFIYCQRCMHLLDVMTSKIFSKNVALKKAETDVVENLVAFGKTPISAHIIASETFLVKCIHRKASCESFDELKMD